MKSKDFEKLIYNFFKKNCLNLMKKKRREYANNNDVFHNFKKVGKRRNNLPEEALLAMKDKQSTSIDDMIQELNYNFRITNIIPKLNKKDLEIFEEKIRDNINYLFLLWGLLNERYLR